MIVMRMALLASASAELTNVTVVPWCDNSMRVMVNPMGSVLQNLRVDPPGGDPGEPFAALDVSKCTPGAPITLTKDGSAQSGNLKITLTGGNLTLSRVDTKAPFFSASASAAGAATQPSTGPVCDVVASLGCYVDSAAVRVLPSGMKAPAQPASLETCASLVAAQVGSAAMPDTLLGVEAGKQCWFDPRNANSAGRRRAPASECNLPCAGNHTEICGGEWRMSLYTAHCAAWTPPPPPPAFTPSSTSGFLAGGLVVSAAHMDERIFGLGQGNYTDIDIVPLERNGQTVELYQTKFHITIPFAYSTAGYGFLWNMPGQGRVNVGAAGTGGMQWFADATTGLDFWVTGTPAGNDEKGAVARTAIYSQYADATGHAPPLREDAMIFWQSRNRYKSSDIVLAVCDKYKQLDLPVGVMVVDYRNQVSDGDFLPNRLCYPSLKELSDGVRTSINATTIFSVWPEAEESSKEYALLNTSGCLINKDQHGRTIDPTTKACRDLIWNEFLKPRYYDQGVSAYWLD
jgi:alpha-D-xyloside xylohydrolase